MALLSQVWRLDYYCLGKHATVVPATELFITIRQWPGFHSPFLSNSTIRCQKVDDDSLESEDEVEDIYRQSASV
jgi:hypothetical protein